MSEETDYHTDYSAPGLSGRTPASVILVHYGSPSPTERCIGSLLAQEGDDLSIVIADHGPAPGLPPSIAKMGSHIRIIKALNQGFGAGCNLAARAAWEAGSNYVWFLNNDATLTEPTFSRLIRLAESYPVVGLWGTLQIDGAKAIGADRLPSWFPSPPTEAESGQGFLSPAGCRRLDGRESLSGASIFLSRATWDRLGPWPEWCFLYYEDVAWCLKAHALGIPIVLTSERILHPRNTTTGRHSPITTYYGVRNGLLLHRDLWPERKSERVRYAIHALQKRFFQGNWHMLGPTWQGIRDAMKGIRFQQPKK